LLFVEPYVAGTQDLEKYIFPDITKVSITINGSPNMLYNRKPRHVQKRPATSS